MKEKQHIKINIADAGPIDLDIPREKEAMVRKIAQNVNMMWSEWASQFSDKTSHDVLAMVAFRYAQVYYDLLQRIDTQKAALADVEKEFDRILLGME